jgi:hypothetical protein
MPASVATRHSRTRVERAKAVTVVVARREASTRAAAVDARASAARPVSDPPDVSDGADACRATKKASRSENTWADVVYWSKVERRRATAVATSANTRPSDTERIGGAPGFVVDASPGPPGIGSSPGAD